MRSHPGLLAAPSFHPLTSIGWAQVHWASDPNWTPPAEGGAITSWRDAAAGNHPFDVLTGTPNYTATEATLNSKPALTFDGSTEGIQTATYDAQDPPMTIVMVCSVNNFGSTRHLYDAKTVGSRNGVRTAATTGLLAVVTTATTTNSDLSMTAAQPSLLIAYLDEGNTYLRLNGTKSSIMSAVNTGGNASGWTLGMAYNGGNKAPCKIAFFGVSSGELPTATQAALHTWAQALYGVPA